MVKGVVSFDHLIYNKYCILLSTVVTCFILVLPVLS
jgi:hypothetical protein